MDSDGSNKTLAFQYNYNAILSETKLLTTGRIENSGVIRSREVKVWKQSESRAIAKKKTPFKPSYLLLSCGDFGCYITQRCYTLGEALRDISSNTNVAVKETNFLQN